MTSQEFEQLKDKPFYLMRIKELEDKNSEYIEALREASLQIEYLHQKFQPTGTGESVLARIKALVK